MSDRIWFLMNGESELFEPTSRISIVLGVRNIGITIFGVVVIRTIKYPSHTLARRAFKEICDKMGRSENIIKLDPNS